MMHTLRAITLVSSFAFALSAAGQSTLSPDTVCFQSSGSTYQVPFTDGYTYTWQLQGPGAVQNGQGSNSIEVDWSNAEPGLIEEGVVVFATDENGCNTDTLTLDIFIFQPNLIPEPVATLCASDDCVELDATPLGGTWSGEGVVDGFFCPSESGPGSFTLTYTYFEVCEFTETLQVQVDPDIDPEITAVAPFCESETVTLQASVPGGTWSANCGNCINPNTGVFSGSASGPGTFTVNYAFNSDCATVATTQVQVVASVDATISSVPALCETGEPIGLTAADAGGTWSADCNDCLNGNVFIPNASGPGTFTVSYEIEGVCSDIDLVDVVVLAQRSAFFTLSNPLCLDAGEASGIPQEGGGEWSASCGDCINSGTGIVDLEANGEGELEITYTFGGLCGAEFSSLTNVIPCQIELPNIFSPNNDGMNDKLEFKNLEFFKDSRLVVTNRWGKVVYEEERYDMFNNWRGDDLAEGVYFYVLTMPDGTEYVGTLTLKR